MTTMICGILDIPVYENPVESLHLLFSLYLEFKHNPIFGQQAADIDQGRCVRTCLPVCAGLSEHRQCKSMHRWCVRTCLSI